MNKEGVINHIRNLQRYEVVPHEYERYKGVIERKSPAGEWVSWNDIYNILMYVESGNEEKRVKHLTG